MRMVQNKEEVELSNERIPSVSHIHKISEWLARRTNILPGSMLRPVNLLYSLHV